MRAYITRRLLLMIPTLFIVTLIVFLSVRFIPGSVIDMMMAEMAEIGEAKAIEVTEAAIKHKLGLDVPVHIQYGRWLGIVPQAEGGFSGIFQGNFGDSLWGGWSIRDELAKRFPVSLEVGLLALTASLLLALPVGVFSAIRQDTAGDYAGRTIAILFISLPSFWVGTMVIVYPSVWWRWSPATTYIPLTENPAANLAQFIVPAVILGMVLSGTTMRMTRTMMLEVLRQDYIRTAWAKGLRERTIIYRHALKNALIPVVTTAGIMLPIMIGGAVILEQIFNLPGIGRLMIEALTTRDYPIVSGINLLVASLIMVANLMIDISYAYLDPRVVYK